MLALDLVLAYNNRGVAYSGLVETEESRTLKEAPPVVDALRDLSRALASLADILNEASSNSLEP